MAFYRHYKTPRLTIQRNESSSNVLLKDGRELLKEPLGPDATNADLEKAAAREILKLVVRDLVNIMPILQEFDESKEHIQLSTADATKIRKVAFLRGHIPYITMRFAKNVAKAFWKRILSAPNYTPEIFVGNMTKMRVYTCDYLCSELPEHLHADIYANGSCGGGRGFNREDMFVIAEEEGIVISSIPEHPLERTPIRVEVPEGSKFKNDLPVPPDPVKKASGQDFPLDKDFLLRTRDAQGTLSDKTFRNVTLRIQADAREKIYTINREPADRFQMMRYIPWAMTEGKTLRDICQGKNGTPTMLEIARWLQWYPDFRHELEAAEAIQAHTFADQALEIIMSSSGDKEELNLAKAQHNALMKRAALQAEKFREKKILQTEDLNMKDAATLKNKLKMLIMGKKELLGDVIDVTPYDERLEAKLQEDLPAVPDFGSEDAI